MTGSFSTTLGILNPFRYRGYVYDEETGLYYLRSRYYNPAWGRFINSDTLLGEVGAVGSHNQFAYCGNNPVVRVDYSGCAYTYDAIDAYMKPPTTMQQIEELFGRMSEAAKCSINGDRFTDGTWSYNKTTKIVAESDAGKAFEELASIGSAAISGYLSTVLINNPVVGAFVSVAQYSITELMAWAKAISVPSIPDGVYTHEIAAYKKDTPGFFGHTFVYEYHYLHGYDASGCTYYAIWSETSTITLVGMEYSSYVIS